MILRGPREMTAEGCYFASNYIIILRYSHEVNVNMGMRLYLSMSHAYISFCIWNSRVWLYTYCNMHIFSVLIFLTASAVIRSAPSAHNDSEAKGFGTAKHVLVIGCDGFGMLGAE